MAFLRFAFPKNMAKELPKTSGQSIRQLTYNVKRIVGANKKKGEPEVYQVTTDTHQETDLKNFKNELERFNIFSVLDKSNAEKEPALLVVKDKPTFTFEDVLTSAAKPRK